MENNLYDTINEHSHMPYYVQIKCYLRQIIKEIGPNALVPSEKELADKFGVSRGTAKQAIMDLVYEGVLYRKQGKGTFTASHIARNYDRLPPFTQDIIRSGRAATCKPLKFNHSVPAQRARVFFELADDETVIRYKRLVLDDDEPIAVVSSFLSGHLYRGLQLSDIGDSLYDALDKKFQAATTQAHDTYSIAEISPKTASLLNQPENSVIIYSERLAYLSDGTPAEFVESVIRADKFKLEVDYKSHEKDDKASSSVEVNFRI